MLDDDTRYMTYALKEAEKAYDEGEVPVGAVVILDGEIIGKAHNLRETLQDPTAHAEVLAITQAANHMKSWRLEGASLYVTLEPCAMCSGAIILARLAKVVYGAKDPKAGCSGSLMDLLADTRFNHQPEVVSDFMAEPCGGILTAFFREIRAGGKPGMQN